MFWYCNNIPHHVFLEQGDCQVLLQYKCKFNRIVIYIHIELVLWYRHVSVSMPSPVP